MSPLTCPSVFFSKSTRRTIEVRTSRWTTLYSNSDIYYVLYLFCFLLIWSTYYRNDKHCKQLLFIVEKTLSSLLKTCRSLSWCAFSSFLHCLKPTSVHSARVSSNRRPLFSGYKCNFFNVPISSQVSGMKSFFFWYKYTPISATTVATVANNAVPSRPILECWNF